MPTRSSTPRCFEQLLYGSDDLDESRRVVDAVGVPVNVLLVAGGPTVSALCSVGEWRVDRRRPRGAAHGALVAAAQEVVSRPG
jgi:hypothetical protein